MLRYAREKKENMGEEIRRDLPLFLESGQGRQWEPLTDEIKQDLSTRQELFYSFWLCRPAPQIDDKSNFPITVIDTIETWEIYRQEIKKDVDIFGAISLDWEDNVRRVVGLSMYGGRKRVKKHRYLLIGTFSPRFYLIDCHS